ncbi:MAG: thioredoxin domain-containing protein [Sphingomonas sp.]|nr:thioredoxin domain-containing protein [Sphingomonas sp.]
MKTSALLLSVAAVFASAACNAEKSSDVAAAPGAPAEAVAPPAGGDWSQAVTATPAGGFLMGNPNAAVKLVEYGSMTCPHCREFDEAGMQPLVDQYVKAGRVSFEFRNYVRDPFDLASALIARCNGAKGFFPLTRAMFKDQPKWIAKLQTVTPEQQQALTGLGPDRQFVEIAKLAGFQQWAAQRGLPSAKSSACLSNEAEVNRLVQMTSDANTEFPQFPGTPAFTLNGKLVENASNWASLEPKLREAVGN